MTLSFAPERVETWPLERLKPHPRNAKTHGADQLAKIAGSMPQFGWTVPVLVAGNGEVVAGHGRILAATQLGLTEAPGNVALDHLTEGQRRAYRYRRQQAHLARRLGGGAARQRIAGMVAKDFDLSSSVPRPTRSTALEMASKTACARHGDPTTDSMNIRPAIPRTSDHPFRQHPTGMI